jgi:hypothetical protein
MSKAADLLRQAEQLARTASTWADLSNALYDPIEGLLARAYPTRAERQDFIRTAEYQQIQRLLTEAMERQGLVAGGSPTRITEFMVQFHLSLPPERDAPSQAPSGVPS